MRVLLLAPLVLTAIACSRPSNDVTAQAIGQARDVWHTCLLKAVDRYEPVGETAAATVQVAAAECSAQEDSFDNAVIVDSGGSRGGYAFIGGVKEETEKQMLRRVMKIRARRLEEATQAQAE